MIMEANKTTTALLDNSALVGQETLCTSSLYESLKYCTIFFIEYLIDVHGRRGSNSRQPVLETGTLPTELLPCLI